MQYVAPANLDTALDVLSSGTWVVVAGGTDFYPARVGRPLLDPVVDISGVSELRGITMTDDTYRIGALTTWAQIRDSSLPPVFDGLGLAAREVGAVQVQNAGTIGGNLCNASPAADGIPPLLALDASVELTSASGTRTMAVEEFLTGYRQTALRPGELLTSVTVPRKGEGSFSDFQKLGSRSHLVISIVMVASMITLDDGVVSDARVAVGSCSPVAQRLRRMEEALRGHSVQDNLESLVEPAHLSVLSPIDDVRAPAWYRLEATQQLIQRSLRHCQDAT